MCVLLSYNLIVKRVHVYIVRILISNNLKSYEQLILGICLSIN